MPGEETFDSLIEVIPAASVTPKKLSSGISPLTKASAERGQVLNCGTKSRAALANTKLHGLKLTL
jgi:hypothetical protein